MKTTFKLDNGSLQEISEKEAVEVTGEGNPIYDIFYIAGRGLLNTYEFFASDCGEARIMDMQKQG